MKVTIETHNLSRLFGNFVAVDKLDLSIYSGEIFGLLGPNAAGKSTTIRMLAGILQASSGAAQILGFNLITESERIKKQIGYVAQQFSLYPDLTVFENLAFYAGLYGVTDKQRLLQLLELYELTQFRDRPANFLSGGYKRRLAIACATPHDPQLIFLDEPTAGIDPVTRKELWDLFYRLTTEGKTLFVTTHYMEEAERCHRLAFLSHGKRVAAGSPVQIRNSLEGQKVFAGEIQHNPKLTGALSKAPGVRLVNQFGSELRIITEASVTSESLQKLIASNYTEPFELQLVTASMEDAFMSLTSDSKSL